MSLNKTNIEWCDKSWNPVSGCDRGCTYCYARKIAERFKGSKAWPNGFKPTFHSERLFDPFKEKKPQTIFVCSMADIFGTWTPDGWIHSVFMGMLQAQRHTYILLTKDANRAERRLTDNFYQWGDKLMPSKLPSNWWVGATVESSKFTGRIDDLRRVPTENRFVSFEPLIGTVDSVDFPFDLTGIKQVIIGAQTKPTVIPKWDWVIDIQKEADRVGAKVFCKDSLSYLNIGERNDYFRRELCWKVNK